MYDIFPVVEVWTEKCFSPNWVLLFLVLIWTFLVPPFSVQKGLVRRWCLQGLYAVIDLGTLCTEFVLYGFVCCRVQELMSDDQREAGRIPRTIECELVQDLVDSCVPGDVVTITGVVKVSSTEEGKRFIQEDFFLYVCGFSVDYTRETTLLFHLSLWSCARIKCISLQKFPEFHHKASFWTSNVLCCLRGALSLMSTDSWALSFATHWFVCNASPEVAVLTQSAS